MAKRIQQESGEERVAAKSRPMMNLTARMPLVVSSPTSSSPGKTWYKILGNLLWQMIDQGNLIDSPQQVIQNRIMIVLGLLKSGKVRLGAHDRSGKPEKISWDMMQQVAPHREEPLLDGNAHSVR